MELLISRSEFSANNPYGEFVAGDVLEVFVETDDVVPPILFSGTGVYCKKNGVLYTGSTIVEYGPKPYRTITEFKPQFCSGTYLITTGYEIIRPFAFLNSEADSLACDVNPPTCNLIIVGPPDVIPASAVGEQDGSIVITAQSSNPIKYKIGSNFNYEDGTGQTDNGFYELLPGEYRIYLADSKNCKASIVVTVPVGTEYGPLYRLEYDDMIGGKSRIDIGKRGYSGEITEVCGTGNPLMLSMRGEGNDDKFVPVLASEGIIELSTSFDGQFRDLYTSDPDLYRVYVYKSLTGDFSRNPFDDAPLSTWVNEDYNAQPSVYWTLGDEPSVRPFISSTYLTSPISGIPIGDHFVYLEASRGGSSNYRATIDFLAGGIVVGSAVTTLIGSDISGTLVTISSVPDKVRIRVYRADGVRLSTITIHSISLVVDVRPVWQGKVIPGIIEEDYKAPPYTFTVRATDGLPKLTDIYLTQSDGQRFYGKVSLVFLLAYCLSKTKILLNIRIACNLYAVGMTTTDQSDPFEQSFVDYDLFYIYSDRPTLQDVLDLILSAFAARLVQWDGYWNVVRIEENVAAYDFRVFSPDGSYVGNGTFNPVVDLGYPADNEPLHYVKADQNLEIRPGFGTIRVLYHLGYKDNILRNGDFRLKSQYNDQYNIYTYTVNTDGFTIANGGAPKSIGYANLEEGNIALEISLQDSVNSGKGYIISDTYNVKMGLNNSMNFSIKYKIHDGVQESLGLTLNKGLPYNKVRIVIQYGDLYFTATGGWVYGYNEIVIFENRYNEFIEYAQVLKYPSFAAWDEFQQYGRGALVTRLGSIYRSLFNFNTGNDPALPNGYWSALSFQPVSGMPFKVKVFDSYILYSDFQDIAVFKAFDTTNLSPGYRTEFRGQIGTDTGNPSYIRYMYYYELRAGTDSNLDYSIIRPDDYHPTNNAKVWVLATRYLPSLGNSFAVSNYYDKIQVEFLTDGKPPIDLIVRDRDGERNNDALYVKEFFIGSKSDLIVTNRFFAFDYIRTRYVTYLTSQFTFVEYTENALSAELVYAGYLRASNGAGWENWTRDGIAEADKLHGIMLRVYAAQYKKSWRRMRGSFRSNTGYFGLLNVIREINANNRIYMPIGISIDDKNNIYSGELLELTNIYENPGSDGSGEAPYSSGFTFGFGASGFN